MSIKDEIKQLVAAGDSLGIIAKLQSVGVLGKEQIDLIPQEPNVRAFEASGLLPRVSLYHRMISEATGVVDSSMLDRIEYHMRAESGGVLDYLSRERLFSLARQVHKLISSRR
jgi:hypothetical protein